MQEFSNNLENKTYSFSSDEHNSRFPQALDKKIE